jgi:molybdate transport repressor ModE-like protein
MMGAMEIDVRIQLLDDEGRPFMGIGLVWLLQGIERLGSVRAAADEMALSYPKACRMIRQLEQGLGQSVVLRTRGGRDGGGAELTEFGRDFVGRYDAMQRQIKRAGQAVYDQVFGDAG